MSDAMPKEQKEFIGDIASYVDTTTNYGTERATQFAFEVWQNRCFLAEYLGKQIRADAIDECIKTVKDYFCKLLEEHEEWEIDSIDDFALIPNKNICKALKQLKSQN